MYRKSEGYLSLIFTSMILAPALPSWGYVNLPLEVLGAEGTIVSADFSLSGPPSSDLQLQATCHNLAYEDKGSLRVNGGAWILLNKATVKCHASDAAFGCIGGPLATLRIKVPLTGQSMKAGINRIEFRFNQGDGLSIGYRIVDFTLIDGAGKSVLDPSQFLKVDPYPATPATPAPSQADVDAGNVLWYSKPLLSNNQPGSKSIRARCSDCHAQDGRDLKYFGFSAHSIVERSKFHGMTDAEGRKVAAYIGSLKVSAHGRPWNPPYQPGPGLDQKPVDQWAAGAGLQAILNSDLEMVPYLFPKGIGPKAFAAGENSPVRETPISLQLPDWNRWLPEVHPLDLWGEAFAEEAAFKSYQKARVDLTTVGKSALLAEGSLGRVVGSFMDKADLLRRDFDTKTITHIDPDTGRSNIMHWSAIKQWELMQEFALEDASRAVAGPQGELRSWFTQGRNVFEMAPHRTATNGTHFKGQSFLAGKYFSTSWYELQTIINPGNRNPKKLDPVDWNYQPAHIHNLASIGGPRQPLRLTRTYLVMLQQYADLPITSTNFGTNQLHPGRFSPDGPGYGIFADIDPAIRAQILSSLLNSIMDVFEMNPISDWPRRDVPGVELERSVEPADYMPIRLGGDIDGAVHVGRWADGFLTSVHEFRAAGVDRSAICRMGKWGMAMWPKGDWQAAIGPGACPDVSVRSRNGRMDSGARRKSGPSLWVGGLTGLEGMSAGPEQGPRIDAAGRILDLGAPP